VTDTAINALSRAQFEVSDILRRAQGNVVGAFGLNPQESPYQIISSGAYWRLRDLWRQRPIAISADHRRADQKTLHLGPHAFD
jgi:hypothetical protein